MSALLLALLGCSQRSLPEPFDIVAACPAYEGVGLGDFDRDGDRLLTRDDLDPGTAVMVVDISTADASFTLANRATDGVFRPLPFEVSRWGLSLGLGCEPAARANVSYSEILPGLDPRMTNLGIDFVEREVIGGVDAEDLGPTAVTLDRAAAVASGEFQGELHGELRDLFREEPVASYTVRHFAFHDVEVRR